MANISWTSGVGSAAVTLTLGSPMPAPANRFFEYTPDYDFTGESKVALTGIIQTFKFREDYSVSIMIRHLLPNQHSLMLMLKKHLMDGGEVTLNTEDLDTAVYENVTLMPGTKPQIKNDEDELQEFSFAVILRSDSEITINYDG